MEKMSKRKIEGLKFELGEGCKTGPREETKMELTEK
jgi:hypothetical protein